MAVVLEWLFATLVIHSLNPQVFNGIGGSTVVSNTGNPWFESQVVNGCQYGGKTVACTTGNPWFES